MNLFTGIFIVLSNHNQLQDGNVNGTTLLQWRQLRKCSLRYTYTKRKWHVKRQMANGKKSEWFSFYFDFRWQMDFSFLFSFSFSFSFSFLFFFVTYFRRWRRRLRLWRRWCCYVCVFLVTKRVTSTYQTYLSHMNRLRCNATQKRKTIAHCFCCCYNCCCCCVCIACFEM